MTSPSPLDRLAGPGNVLAKEPPDAKEFAGLVPSGLTIKRVLKVDRTEPHRDQVRAEIRAAVK